MPIISAYPNGCTAYIPSGGSMHKRAKRAAIKGWTAGAVRRHGLWLKSIPIEELTGWGYAVTLTMRDCPPTSKDFHKARRAYLMRVDRMGAVRLHWVIEWQRRGFPHMHMAIYFDRELTRGERETLKQHWVDLCGPWGALMVSQDLKPISGPMGWLKYLSKHAGRGAAHYQRNGKPEGWETTGRLWGHTGVWNERPGMRFAVPDEAFYRFRRLVRSWRYADARSESDPVTRRMRMVSARHMLRCADRGKSPMRGVSEWATEDQTLAFLALLAADGVPIRQVDG